MLSHRLQHLVEPQERLRSETDVTPQLMADVMAQAGVRPAELNSARAARLRRLIAAEAWTDAALALIEFALPQWQVMRLVYDDEEWCCALSRHPQMPAWLDDAIEARHEVLPLALLGAFQASREASPTSPSSTHATVPHCRLQQQLDIVHALCCDDYA
jgi:hypothetical protein